MAFIRVGSRLANGSRSGAYVFGVGEHISISVKHGSAKRRGCTTQSVKLTYEEVIAIAQSCQDRGWLKDKK